MEYALVGWSFSDGVRPGRVFYTYKTELTNLKRGDVVLLEARDGGSMMGVFYRYIDEDRNPFNMYRASILKKVHTNTIKARVCKRYEQFKDIQLSPNKKKAKKMKKLLFIFFRTDNEEIIYRKLIRTFCYGNELKIDNVYNAWHYIYKDRILSVYIDKEGIWRLLNVSNGPSKTKWVQATKNHYNLTILMEKEEEKRVFL